MCSPQARAPTRKPVAEDAEGGEQKRPPDPVQGVVDPDGPWVQLALGETGAGAEQEGEVRRDVGGGGVHGPS